MVAEKMQTGKIDNASKKSVKVKEKHQYARDVVSRQWISFSFYFSSTVYIQYYCVLVSVYSTVGKQSYTLQSIPPDISSAQLAPFLVVTILLTIFPMLYLHPYDYFEKTNL